MIYDDEHDDLGTAVEAALQSALDNPMPRELREAVASAIEPLTINAQIKHGDVMDCISVAYPLIRGYLTTGEAHTKGTQ